MLLSYAFFGVDDCNYFIHIQHPDYASVSFQRRRVRHGPCPVHRSATGCSTATPSSHWLPGYVCTWHVTKDAGHRMNSLMFYTYMPGFFCLSFVLGDQSGTKSLQKESVFTARLRRFDVLGAFERWAFISPQGVCRPFTVPVRRGCPRMVDASNSQLCFSCRWLLDFPTFETHPDDNCLILRFFFR